MKSISLSALLLLVVFFVQPTLLQAAIDLDRFEDAARAYSSNDLQRAITIYEKLIDENGYAPGLVYNLANSYARTGQTGKAVLNYNRALLLQPQDSDTLGNLQFIRNNSGLFQPDYSLVESVARLLSINQWAVLGTAGLLIATVAILLSIRFRIAAAIVIPLTAICCTITMLAVAGTWVRFNEIKQSVVIADTRLQISPFEGAASAGDIQQGRLVKTIKQHNHYVLVEDKTGRRGWLQQATVEGLLPVEGN